MQKKIYILITIILTVTLVFKSYEYFHYLIPESKNNPFFDLYYQYNAAQGAVDKDEVLYYYKKLNIYHPYSPFTSVLYIPLINFNYYTASLIFLFFNISLLACILFLFRLILFKESINYAKLNLVFLIIFFFQPLWINLKNGQNNILISFIFIIIYYLNLKSFKLKNLIISFFIAFGFLVKILPIFLFLYFIMKKNFKIIFLTFFWIGILILFSLIFMEFNEYVCYLTEVFPNYFKTNWLTKTLNCKSLYSYLLRIFGHSIEHPESIYYFPKLIKPLNLLIIFYFFLFIIKYRKFCLLKDFCIDSLFYSQIILFSQICYAAAWNHTYINILFPLIITFYTILKKDNSYYYLTFIISYILLNLTFDVTKLTFSSKYILLLTSPQLFGLILLFFLSHFILNKECKKSAQ